MDEKIIEKIVRKVFEKAKKEHASHSRFALSNHISDQSSLSSKTLERAYDRYIDGNKKQVQPNAESVDLFCVYLGFDDYKQYLEKNSGKEGGGKSVKWKWLLALTAGLTILVVLINQVIGEEDDLPPNTENSKKKNIDNQLTDNSCMTWADSLYVSVSCNEGPFSKYGTRVDSLDQMKFKKMKKVEVHAAYEFFHEGDENKPLIWYYKTKEGEIEYFTAPGLHPINDETLRKITKVIIQKYVPIHIDRKDSFLE